MKTEKFLHFPNSLSKRFIFAAGGPDQHVEAPATSEPAKEKPDTTTPYGREKINQKAQLLIDDLTQKANAMKANDANNPQAKRLESKATRLQNALNAAKEAKADDTRLGLIDSKDKDFSSKQASKELLRRMDLILNPPQAPAAKNAPTSVAELKAVTSDITASLETDSTAAAKTEKTATSPNDAPFEIKKAAQNYAAEHSGSGVAQLTDKNGVVWEARISNNSGNNPQAAIIYRRASTSAPSAAV